MSLDLTSLKKAARSLERSIHTTEEMVEAEVDKNILEVLKAGVVQNFEFTYELCWKFMKRWLDHNISKDFTSGITRKQLFRYALEYELIDDFTTWVRYHQLRNMTSHTYDQDTANEIYQMMQSFSKDVNNFIHQLEDKND